MGLDSLLQRNMQSAGLAGIDRLASNAMFPQSQMDKTQYATSSQMPTSADVMNADYDAKTDSYTGEPLRAFKMGGIAALRFNGEDGSDVQSVEDPTLGNPDFQNLSYGQMQDTDRLKALNALKTTDPKAYNAQLMGMLSNSIKEQYNTNSNYDQSWKQFEKLKETDPAAWHRAQLGFLGHQVGWQQGQNTLDRASALQPQIQNTIDEAKKAGLSEQEIQQILAGSQQSGNIENQRRIINQQQSGNELGGMVMPVATIAAMALAPELAPFFAGELGALGGGIASGALTGGALGGLGAGITGGDIGKGILTGGATGAIGGGITSGLSGLDPSVAQGLKGLNTARSLYNVAQSGGQNIGADINAIRSISSMAPISAAHGGLMASGGISSLGSYSDGGRLLKGPGDGMSDNIPASIGNKQPARLADGEFVIPADVVSHLGNGSTDAGAKHLYKMMDRIRKARTGNPKQGKKINPDKFLPKG